MTIMQAQSEVRSQSSFSLHLARLSTSMSRWIGHKFTVAGALAITVGWIIYGVAIHFTTEWLLISNAFGTLATLLILLLLQHARQRHALAIQVKVDQLLYSSAAGNHWIGVERHPTKKIDEMRAGYHVNR